ncbi:hypothetical protein [Embleya hyalina]|uniref:hypothetical protein n=1 Tax=Embleya hyalina TaxID=516124 RepID=UPI0027D94E4B|nr:hypothetical protein [Embleya hyalina]
MPMPCAVPRSRMWPEPYCVSGAAAARRSRSVRSRAKRRGDDADRQWIKSHKTHTADKRQSSGRPGPPAVDTSVGATPIGYGRGRRGHLPHADPIRGARITRSGPQGNGSITFFDDGASFQGTARFPGEGPVAYRGTARRVHPGSRVGPAGRVEPANTSKPPPIRWRLRRVVDRAGHRPADRTRGPIARFD